MTGRCFIVLDGPVGNGNFWYRCATVMFASTFYLRARPDDNDNVKGTRLSQRAVIAIIQCPKLAGSVQDAILFVVFSTRGSIFLCSIRNNTETLRNRKKILPSSQVFHKKLTGNLPTFDAFSTTGNRSRRVVTPGGCICIRSVILEMEKISHSSESNHLNQLPKWTRLKDSFFKPIESLKSTDSDCSIVLSDVDSGFK